MTVKQREWVDLNRVETPIWLKEKSGGPVSFQVKSQLTRGSIPENMIGTPSLKYR